MSKKQEPVIPSTEIPDVNIKPKIIEAASAPVELEKNIEEVKPEYSETTVMFYVDRCKSLYLRFKPNAMFYARTPQTLMHFTQEFKEPERTIPYKRFFGEDFGPTEN